MANIVFVVQEPRHRTRPTALNPEGEVRKVNMLPALKFGSLELLLPPEEQMNMLNTAQVTRLLLNKLRNYDDTDYILAAGDPAAIGVACACAAAVNGGRFTVLKWDNQEKEYYAVRVNLKEAM